MGVVLVLAPLHGGPAVVEQQFGVLLQREELALQRVEVHPRIPYFGLLVVGEDGRGLGGIHI